MKNMKFIFAAILLLSTITYTVAQDVRSGKHKVLINNAPKIIILSVKLIDENNDQHAEAEEKCKLLIDLNNKGKTEAKSVTLNIEIKEGITEEITFNQSNFVGNIPVGQLKTVEIPITTGFMIKDGFSTFSFKAMDAEGFDSNEFDHKLPILSKQIPLTVNWDTPTMTVSSSSDSLFKIKACINSSKEINNVKVFFNGEEITSQRGFVLTTKENCKKHIEQEVVLKQGTNTIRIEATDTKNTISTETRTVDYKNIEYESRIALIIGNSKYKIAPLKNPANDAAAMAKALRELNFDVIEIIDGTQTEMRKAIINFNEKLTANPNGVGLFYYAGHGLQIKGENFLIPVKHDIQDAIEIEDRTLKVKSILVTMESSGTRMNIMILDACRNNPFKKSFKIPQNRNIVTNQGWAEVYAKGSGSIIAYATAPGSTASDGDGKNGLYTQELLKAIKTPGLEIGLVFRRVLTSVKKISKGEQVPWTNSSIEGEFYFIK